MIRIVGLSATLPNYRDVASFLGVNAEAGLFYFDASYRPVPLEMQFVGVTDKSMMASRNRMDDLAYDKVLGKVSSFLEIFLLSASRDHISYLLYVMASCLIGCHFWRTEYTCRWRSMALRQLVVLRFP